MSDGPSNTDARVKLGELFLRKYNFADAQTTFDDVLQTNPNNPRALLGAARRLEQDGQPGADSLLRAALNINPEYVEARTLHAEMLLGLEDYVGAQADVDRALRVDPTADRRVPAPRQRAPAKSRRAACSDNTRAGRAGSPAVTRRRRHGDAEVLVEDAEQLRG